MPAIHGDDRRLLRDLKAAVLAGVRAFETDEAEVVDQAEPTLLDATGGALAVVSAHYQRLAGQTRAQGITAAETAEPPIPPDKGLPGHGGPLQPPDLTALADAPAGAGGLWEGGACP